MYRLALARPVSTFVGVVTLVSLGAFSLFKLPVALLPALERPRLLVTARAEGRSREQMLHGVTQPLERRLGSLAGAVSMHGETEDSVSRLLVETAWTTDADRLSIDAARLLDGASEIPLTELTVRVTGGDPSPTVEVAVLGGASAPARSRIAETVLLPELARLPGAGRIEILGRSRLRVVVRPRAAALAARGIAPSDLVDRLRSVGHPTAAGRARTGGFVRPLLVVEPISSLADLRAVRLAGAGGEVPLGDVASVAIEEVAEPTSFRRDGEDGVLLRIYRAPGANAVALARAVAASVATRSGGDLRVVVASDRSREVVAALRELALAALGGILLGTLVLRFTLGQWRSTLALSAVIPTSLVSCFGAFYLFNVPIDVISLAGLALANGMLVDSAIVVLESIEAAHARGEPDAPLAGTAQVAVAVMASCVTSVVVFLPLLYLRGLARAFFGEQAFAVVGAQSISLLLSLTLTPVLAGRQRSRTAGRNPGRSLYLRLLEQALERPVPWMGLGAIATVVTLGSVLLLRRELLPMAAGERILVDYRLPSQVSDQRTEALALQIESALSGSIDRAVVESILCRRGQTASLGADESELVANLGQIEVAFKSVAQAREGKRALVRALATIPDVLGVVRARPSAIVEALSYTGSRLEVVVSAPDEARVAGLCKRVTDHLSRQGVVTRIEEARERLPALYLRWDEARLAELGLSRQAAEAQVAAALGPTDVGVASIAGASPEIRIEGTVPAELPLLPVVLPERSPGASRRVVPLSALARVEVALRPASAPRENGRPAERLVIDTAPSSVDAQELERLVKQVTRAGDESIWLAGEALEISRSFAELRLALGLSLVLVFLTLAGFYESILLPLVIMTTVPVAAGGGLVALVLTGQTLNLMSFIGLILLGGIVVNNAIVLVDRIEQLRLDGFVHGDAVRRAAGERYRPILMTTATTLLGTLPLALPGGHGVELRQAIALVVLGGLVTSTFSSLLLVPVLHGAVERLRTRRP